jgi:hypothetical protein
MFRSVPSVIATEISDTQTTALSSAGPGSLPTITPTKAGGLNILGMILQIYANVTQSAAANWTVGSLVKELKIQKGTNTQIDVNGEDQLEKVFHMLTGLPIGATFNTGAPIYFNNPTSAGAAGQTNQTEEIFLPLQFTTAVVPQIKLTLNGYSAITNATAATVNFTVIFLYGNTPVTDDLIKITTAPAQLNAATDIDVSQYFSEAKPINEVWVEIPADADLNYQTFEIGQATIYPKVDPTSLSFLEAIIPGYTHISGFFKSKMKPGTVFPTSGSTANSPKLIYNLAAAETPTFYMVVAS